MKKYYYTDSENQPQGPYTLAELNTLVQQNVITTETLVCAEGDSAWRPLRELNKSPSLWETTWTAFRSIATSPVEGVEAGGAHLDDKVAAQVGFLFSAAYALCLVLAANQAIGQSEKEGLINLLLPSVTFTAVYLVSCAGSLALVRSIFRGQGSLGKDCFVAGAALLPTAALVIVSGFLGKQNPDVLETLALVLMPVMFLILYGGCRGLANMPPRTAALSVPIVVAAAHWLVKIVGLKMLENLHGYDFFKLNSPFGF
jgi:hypothetical protein